MGRYEYQRKKEMCEFYKIISMELVNVYGYLRRMVKQIFEHYREYSRSDLRCFLKVLPEIEMVCDKIEDVLSNKYIKGKKPSSKLELKEE